jgi:hypothetical protein
MTDKSELETLKERADDMGMKYSPNIGVDTLREKVNAKLNPEPVKEEVETGSYKTNGKVRQALIKKATNLVRVKVVCMNPNKKEIRGEYFTFSNSAVGTVTRFVPFDEETHVESAILSGIRNRKYAKVVMVKGSNGVPYPNRKLISEFGVEVLKPLTEKQIKDLASDQLKRGAIDK